MAVRQDSREVVPKGAVIFNSKGEIVDHYWELVRNWPNHQEVWPLQFSLPAIAAVTTTASLIINNQFRRKLKLRHFGLLTTSFTLAMTPALTTVGGHALAITHDIFTNSTPCFACLQQRALAIQLGFGWAYPLVISPIANFMFAARHGTYRLPFYSDYKGTFQLIGKILKSFRGKLFGLFIGQAVFISYVTYLEKNYFVDFQVKLLELENDMKKEKEEKQRRKQEEREKSKVE